MQPFDKRRILKGKETNNEKQLKMKDQNSTTIKTTTTKSLLQPSKNRIKSYLSICISKRSF